MHARNIYWVVVNSRTLAKLMAPAATLLQSTQSRVTNLQDTPAFLQTHDFNPLLQRIVVVVVI